MSTLWPPTSRVRRAPKLSLAMGVDPFAVLVVRVSNLLAVRRGSTRSRPYKLQTGDRNRTGALATCTALPRGATVPRLRPAGLRKGEAAMAVATCEVRGPGRWTRTVAVLAVVAATMAAVPGGGASPAGALSPPPPDSRVGGGGVPRPVRPGALRGPGPVPHRPARRRTVPPAGGRRARRQPGARRRGAPPAVRADPRPGPRRRQPHLLDRPPGRRRARLDGRLVPLREPGAVRGRRRDGRGLRRLPVPRHPRARARCRRRRLLGGRDRRWRLADRAGPGVVPVGRGRRAPGRPPVPRPAPPPAVGRRARRLGGSAPAGRRSPGDGGHRGLVGGVSAGVVGRPVDPADATARPRSRRSRPTGVSSPSRRPPAI